MNLISLFLNQLFKEGMNTFNLGVHVLLGSSDIINIGFDTINIGVHDLLGSFDIFNFRLNSFNFRFDVSFDIFNFRLKVHIDTCFESFNNICNVFRNFLKHILNFLNSEVEFFILLFEEPLDCLNLALIFCLVFSFNRKSSSNKVYTRVKSCSFIAVECLEHFHLHVEGTSMIINVYNFLIHDNFI